MTETCTLSTRARRLLLLALATALLPLTASAQDRATQPGQISLRGSLGMTAGPETFNMTLDLPISLHELVSVGPMAQLGFSDDHVWFAPTAQVYVTPRLSGTAAAWRPYAHGGIGLAVLEDDDRRPGRDDEDADFLITLGTGIEYEVTDRFLMGTGFLFNVIPGGVVGERFIFGWQILTFRTEF